MGQTIRVHWKDKEGDRYQTHQCLLVKVDEPINGNIEERTCVILCKKDFLTVPFKDITFHSWD